MTVGCNSPPMDKENQLESFIPLIKSTMKRYSYVWVGVDMEDLYQELLMTVWQCIENCTNKASLVSYISNSIRGKIFTYSKQVKQSKMLTDIVDTDTLEFQLDPILDTHDGQLISRIITYAESMEYGIPTIEILMGLKSIREVCDTLNINRTTFTKQYKTNIRKIKEYIL